MQKIDKDQNSQGSFSSYLREDRDIREVDLICAIHLKENNCSKINFFYNLQILGKIKHICILYYNILCLC